MTKKKKKNNLAKLNTITLAEIRQRSGTMACIPLELSTPNSMLQVPKYKNIDLPTDVEG